MNIYTSNFAAGFVNGMNLIKTNQVTWYQKGYTSVISPSVRSYMFTLLQLDIIHEANIYQPHVNLTIDYSLVTKASLSTSVPELNRSIMPLGRRDLYGLVSTLYSAYFRLDSYLVRRMIWFHLWTNNDPVQGCIWASPCINELHVWGLSSLGHVNLCAEFQCNLHAESRHID